MPFRFGALFGWGITIYAIMFFLWSVFLTYGFVEGFLPRAIGLIVLVIVTFVAGSSLRANSWQDILPYSFVWGIMMAIFDGIMSVPFAGWGVYADFAVWFGYGVVVVGPLLALYPHFERFSCSSSRL